MEVYIYVLLWIILIKFYIADKFVIIGAHTDSWTKGGVDHATGYSVIWELARGFSALVRDGRQYFDILIFDCVESFCYTCMLLSLYV